MDEKKNMKVWTALIEGHGGNYSMTYCFDNEKEADEFVDWARRRLYPNYPDSRDSDWAIYTAIQNQIFSNAAAAADHFAEDQGLDDYL